MSKLDPALTLALHRDGGKGDAPFDVTVRVQQPLSGAQARALRDLGVVADGERTVFAGRVTRDSLKRLTRSRCVAQVTLAQPMRLAGGMAPPRSMGQ